MAVKDAPEPQSSKWLEVTFKVLSALVVPILAWAIQLQVSLAVLNTEVTALKESRNQIRVQYDDVNRQYNSLLSDVRSMNGTIREIQGATNYVRETVTDMRNEIRSNQARR